MTPLEEARARMEAAWARVQEAQDELGEAMEAYAALLPPQVLTAEELRAQRMLVDAIERGLAKKGGAS